MAVTVLWDDSTEVTWEEGQTWEQEHPRGPWNIYNGTLLIGSVPDFGVRFVTASTPIRPVPLRIVESGP